MPSEYGFEIPKQGVGAVLSINAHTRAFDKFFAKLPSSYGRPVDQSRAHVTLVDSAETAIDVFSERDLRALEHTGKRFLEYLGGIPLDGMVLQPDPETDRLENFGRHLGITVAQTSAITTMRQQLSEISINELGTNLDREYVPHLSVARKPSGRKKTKGHVPPFPQNIHVNGFSVDVRAFRHNPKRAKNRSQQYRNKPQGTTAH